MSECWDQSQVTDISSKAVTFLKFLGQPSDSSLAMVLYNPLKNHAKLEHITSRYFIFHKKKSLAML